MVNKTQSDASYIEWSAVIAGSVLASAISIIILHFGNAVGLSVASNYDDVQQAKVTVFTVSLWILWAQLIASVSGGYLAGRMRSTVDAKAHEVEVRDGAHGLLVWATSTVAAAIGAAIVAAWAAIAAQHSAEVQQQADNIVNLTRNAGIIISFTTVASAIVSAVAAWYIAIVGGEHRDKAVDVSRHISFRRSKKA
jgi:MFS family permease